MMCPKCGMENALSTDAACWNCGAVLPKPVTPAERLVAAAGAVVEMLPHGSDRYELAVAVEEYKTCKCGNLIVMGHGDTECAVCYMKRKGTWEDAQ
jgi:hypothetical protein